MTAVLHIYGQEHEHATAAIVGNRDALEQLRDAITKALEGKPAATGSVFVLDGKGYQVVVAERDVLDDLPGPYSDDDSGWGSGEQWHALWLIIREATCTSNR